MEKQLSEEAKLLARLAPKASQAAIEEAWAHGLSVTVLEGDKIVSIAPDGTKTFVKYLEPI
ncbi:MAG: hypothetical protein J6P80_05195 [Kiritimatiellae bacterium]|nr:hypothetical protein [Kiritimatiellia bacterium]